MRNLISYSMRVLAAVSLLAATSVVADHHAGWGPELGSSIPAGIALMTQAGKAVDFNELITDKGVAIAFVRSADWCPFCKRQIIDLNKSLDEFEKRGVRLVALSYDSVDILKVFSDKHDIGYTLISDNGSKVIEALGIRNEEHDEDSMGYGIPHPGIMVFDSEGTLVAKFAEEGYRKRPSVENVLKAVDRHL